MNQTTFARLPWSSIGIPNILPLSERASVREMSSSLGLGSPEGWLCATIAPAQCLRISIWKVSLGVTMLELRLPMEIVFSNTTVFLVFRPITWNSSTWRCSSLLRMEKWDKPSTGQEALQREFGDRPWLIKDRVKTMRKAAVVPEDEEEEQEENPREEDA